MKRSLSVDESRASAGFWVSVREPLRRLAEWMEAVIQLLQTCSCVDKKVMSHWCSDQWLSAGRLNEHDHFTEKIKNEFLPTVSV